MKKRAHIILIAVVLLYVLSFSADAARVFYVNDGGETLPVHLPEAYAIGENGTVQLWNYHPIALTGEGLAELDVSAGSMGGLKYDDGSVKVATDRIRVGLCYYFAEYRDSSLEEARLENEVGSGYAFGYLDGDHRFVPFDSEAFTEETRIAVRPLGDSGVGVYITGTDTLLYSMERTDKDHYLAVHPLSEYEVTLTWFDGRRYYGDFAYADLGNGKVSVVNVVDVEPYVMGVLLGEMGTSFPLEALKAQAVAARTYAMYNVHSELYYNLCGFHVSADTYCQVYRGYTDANNIVLATNSTANCYLTYENRIIQALYFAADGGETLDSEKVFPNEIPYLRGVKDPYEESVWKQGAYGHQVGMSQWGAYAMADKYGKNYKEILGFYFTDVGLSYGYQ